MTLLSWENEFDNTYLTLNFLYKGLRVYRVSYNGQLMWWRYNTTMLKGSYYIEPEKIEELELAARECIFEYLKNHANNKTKVLRLDYDVK